jgi:hypothetical protein
LAQLAGIIEELRLEAFALERKAINMLQRVRMKKRPDLIPIIE